MVSMQGLAIQRLPHDIPPEAARDYAHTGWDGKLDIDGFRLDRDLLLIIRRYRTIPAWSTCRAERQQSGWDCILRH